MKDLRIGDVVIIVNESLPHGIWPRGWTCSLYPGKDGVIRVVDVVEFVISVTVH